MCPIYHIGREQKRMGDRLKLVTFRVKCFVWTDKDGAGPFSGFGFAADISDKGAGIYLNEKFAKGTAVRVALEEEDSTPYRGIVAWGQRYSLQQKFKGHSSLDCRVGVEFRFESEADRQRYLMFFNELRSRATSIKNQFRF